MTDPIQRWRRRIALTSAAGALAAGLCAIWAVSSGRTEIVIEPVDLGPVGQRQHPTDADAQIAPLDREAFAARLCNPPPAEEPDPQPARVDRAAPLNLELIAIIVEPPIHSLDGTGSPAEATDEGDGGAKASRLRAVLYDPQTDRLYIAGHGETMLGHTVTALTGAYIELSVGAGSRRLNRTGGTGP